MMSGYWFGKGIAFLFSASYFIFAGFVLGDGYDDGDWWKVALLALVGVLFGVGSMSEDRDNWAKRERERLTKKLAKLPPDSASVSVPGSPP